MYRLSFNSLLAKPKGEMNRKVQFINNHMVQEELSDSVSFFPQQTQDSEKYCIILHKSLILQALLKKPSYVPKNSVFRWTREMKIEQLFIIKHSSLKRSHTLPAETLVKAGLSWFRFYALWLIKSRILEKLSKLKILSFSG